MLDLCYARPTDVMDESTFKMGYYLGLKYVQNNQNVTLPNPHNRNRYCLHIWSDGFFMGCFFP